MTLTDIDLERLAWPTLARILYSMRIMTQFFQLLLLRNYSNTVQLNSLLKNPVLRQNKTI